MTRDRFTDEMRRLAEGFNTKLTMERLNALWSKFRHFTEPTVKDAVDELLTGSHYPNRSELEKAIDAANERENHRNRPSASTIMDLGPRCPPERAKFYTRLAQWFYSQPKWPTFSVFEAWITDADLADRPDDWRIYATSIWAQNPPGTMPGGLAAATGRVVGRISMTPEERAAKIVLLRSKGWGGEKAPSVPTSGKSESSRPIPHGEGEPSFLGDPGALALPEPDRGGA